MISQTERDFVECFLAALRVAENKTIPFDNDSFSKGLDSVAEYFLESNIGEELKNRLSLLFVKQTTYGEYSRFQNIMRSMNGGNLSLVNPRLVNAIINMSDDYVELINENDKLGIGSDFYREMAVAFCKGAEVSYS